ncbi:hypothetical protein MYP_1054 [Sporocytophaga myxococcoides]|uniref:Uncharacterized protein n=1 Tax=Sporocytophaga myxococcoides TaxID=153721 RepID=A0A098LA84_9BACT|nr:hypothetical protein [Sporocytophaga myxococcoides]GAL83826.1 hypothetical protein MYP_1054 [Sporocytophaga myxococcoides]
MSGGEGESWVNGGCCPQHIRNLDEFTIFYFVTLSIAPGVTQSRQATFRRVK